MKMTFGVVVWFGFWAGTLQAGAGTATITGTIGFTNGLPLNNLTVVRAFPDLFPGSFQSETVITDSNGTYAFSNIAESTSFIKAGGGGFVEEWFNSTTNGLFDKSNFLSVHPDAEELSLSAGVTVSNINFMLGPSASITVTVQDVASAPLNGFFAKVWFPNDGGFSSGTSDASDSFGIAVIDGLWPDDFLLNVANGSANTIDQFFDGVDYFGSESPPPSGATSIPLTFGSTTSIVMTINEGDHGRSDLVGRPGAGAVRVCPGAKQVRRVAGQAG
jgi:hypothetical protein